MPNLKELSWKLQLERLFVKSELVSNRPTVDVRHSSTVTVLVIHFLQCFQEAIHELNKRIRIQSEQLSHLYWTTRQHHVNLNHFITNSSHGKIV